MKHLKLILLAAAIIISGCTERLSIVKVEGGEIEGVPSGTEGVIVYKGIPFAAPPVGDLRWKA
ncbi:MAG: carboxylesterase family protein, partial [Bacteroidales bacterium]|nr:carboxylesterase family protein [Bacteroidales bacterium]